MRWSLFSTPGTCRCPRRSPALSCITGSSTPVAKMTEALIHGRKASAVNGNKGRVAKMLGVGTVGGGRRTTKVFQKRFADFNSKKSQIPYH